MDVLVFGAFAEFEGFVEEAADDFVELLEFLLGVEEALGDGVVHEFVAEDFKLGDFVHGQFDALALFHAEEVAEAVDLLVLEFQKFVTHEGVEFLFEGAKIVLLDDGLAEVEGALGDGAFFGFGVHAGRGRG